MLLLLHDDDGIFYTAGHSVGKDGPTIRFCRNSKFNCTGSSLLKCIIYIHAVRRLRVSVCGFVNVRVCACACVRARAWSRIRVWYTAKRLSYAQSNAIIKNKPRGGLRRKCHDDAEYEKTPSHTHTPAHNYYYYIRNNNKGNCCIFHEKRSPGRRKKTTTHLHNIM